MNNEIISILDHLERERGIKRDILIEAIESAILSAARKSFPEKALQLSVKMDHETAEIKVLDGEQEITSPNFGRIAAQTAKQIIIQKIREAERDVIYNEYVAKVNTVTNGTIHRFEKGSIIVDLDKTEGLIPKKEQSSKESYRMGDRIRAFIVSVERTTRGPQIILSRTHPGLVKRLFELEVPEIYEGIVEIKGVAREAGDRSKVAVCSKDEKVDCVGACVGMRGSRVKNIVRELQGEKLDIVRWSESSKDFIEASLSPAQVSEIKLDRENKKALVIVPDDQLSLAIGKKGQNVRLTAKLTGWDIDIKSISQLAAEKVFMIDELEGVGKKTLAALKGAGFDSIQKLAASSLEELTQVKGVSERTAAKAVKLSKEFLEARQVERKAEEVVARTQQLKARLEEAEAKLGVPEPKEEAKGKPRKAKAAAAKKKPVKTKKARPPQADRKAKKAKAKAKKEE